MEERRLWPSRLGGPCGARAAPGTWQVLGNCSLDERRAEVPGQRSLCAGGSAEPAAALRAARAWGPRRRVRGASARARERRGRPRPCESQGSLQPRPRGAACRARPSDLTPGPPAAPRGRRWSLVPGPRRAAFLPSEPRLILSPACRAFGIFHDKVMTSRNEINPTHIFMENGSFLENN